MTKLESLEKQAGLLKSIGHHLGKLKFWKPPVPVHTGMNPLTELKLVALGTGAAAVGGIALARKAEQKALDNEVRRHQYDKQKAAEEARTLIRAARSHVKSSSLDEIFHLKPENPSRKMPKIRNTIFRGGNSTGREIRGGSGIDKGRQVVHKGGATDKKEQMRLIGMFGLNET